MNIDSRIRVAKTKKEIRTILSEHLHAQEIIEDSERDVIAEKLHEAYSCLNDVEASHLPR